MSKLAKNIKLDRATASSQKLPRVKIKLNVFISEAFLYLTTLTLGLITAWQIAKTLPQVALDMSSISWPRFLIYFALGTLLIFLFLKFSQVHSRFFLEIVFALAIFSGSQIIFGLFMPDFWAMFCAALLVIWRFLHPSVLTQNLAMILAIAGIGALIGLSLSIASVIIILMVLSVYDFIAVYKTKHMIKMAKRMMKQRLLLAFVVPEGLTGFRGRLADIKPGGRMFVLGSGDVVMPLVAVAAMAHLGLAHSLLVMLFSFLGLFFMHAIFSSQKIRRPMAALPPIALFTILGILVSLLVFGI